MLRKIFYVGGRKRERLWNTNMLKSLSSPKLIIPWRMAKKKEKNTRGRELFFCTGRTLPNIRQELFFLLFLHFWKKKKPQKEAGNSVSLKKNKFQIMNTRSGATYRSTGNWIFIFFFHVEIRLFIRNLKKWSFCSRFSIHVLPDQSWVAQLEYSSYKLHTLFRTFVPDLCAHSVLISALELSRKFSKSALLVGQGWSNQSGKFPHTRRLTDASTRTENIFSTPHPYETPTTILPVLSIGV